MKTIRTILVLLFVMLLALNIVYVVPTLAQGTSTLKTVSKPSASMMSAITNMSKYSIAKNVPVAFFTAISNEPDGVATYCTAQLYYDKNSGTFTGDGDQYFSNRQWSPPTTGNYAPTSYYPFDPQKTDNLRLILDTNSDSATLVLLSHGNTQETIGLQARNKVLYGFTSTSPATMFAISFQGSEQIPQKPPATTVGNTLPVSNFISTYGDFLSNAPSGKLRYVTFTAISNEPDGVTTYSYGDMGYDKYNGILTGDGDQYFSDRLWSNQYPFDPQKTDKLRLILDKNSGSATLVLLSHGTFETIGLQVSNNVLYGFTNTSPAAMFIISLKETELNAP
jgi:hypothetical protein